jgi:YggT family protein
MFIFGEIFYALAKIVNFVGTALYFLIIARVVISWLSADSYNPIVQFIIQITEPVLTPFRRLPLRFGMLDLSPIVALIAVIMAQRILVGILVSIASRFGSAPGL